MTGDLRQGHCEDVHLPIVIILEYWSDSLILYMEYTARNLRLVVKRGGMHYRNGLAMVFCSLPCHIFPVGTLSAVK